MGKQPLFGFFRCRFVLAAIVGVIFCGHPYSLPGDEKVNYTLLEDYNDNEWNSLCDMIKQARAFCCRNDSRDIQATGDGDGGKKSLAAWSGNPEFTTDYEHCLLLIDLQKSVAPLRAILKSGRSVEEMAEAITNHL